MRDIEIKGLCKAFDGKQVLRDFSAVLPAGQVTGLMAPSGAGKTTLLRILMGLETQDRGIITGLDGLRLSAVFQEDRLCENLNPVSNPAPSPAPVRLRASVHKNRSPRPTGRAPPGNTGQNRCFPTR